MKRIFNININSVIVLKLFSKIIFGICFLSALANAEGAAAPVSSTLATSEAFVTQALAQTKSIQSGAAAIQPAVQTSSALTGLNTAVNAYGAAAKACDAQVKLATGICDEKMNPEAIAIGLAMEAGEKIIMDTISPSENCSKMGAMSNIGKQATNAVKDKCVTNMGTCSSLCTQAQTALGVVQKNISALGTAINNDANTAMIKCSINNACQSLVFNAQQSLSVNAEKLATSATAQQASAVAPPIASCSALTLDIAKYAGQAAGLLTSLLGSKKCEKQLTTKDEDPDGSDGGPDVDGGGGGGEFESAELEMCKDPTIAALPVCKCKTDSKAEGCGDNIAKNSNGPIKGLGAGSQLAGIGGGMKQKGGSSVGIPAASTDAKSEIAKPTTGTDTGTAAAANSGSGSGTYGSGFTSDAPVVGSDSEKMNNGRGGGFASMGGDGGFSGGSKKSGSASEKQIAEAKRKMASEELAKLVSPASGKTNWDKVTTRYDEIDSSFMGK